MTGHRLEVADVLRSYAQAYLEMVGGSATTEQRRVLRDLVRCRTAALGGHVEACDECGHRRIAYNSCRNRHCPKCQMAARARWLEQRSSELLPVEYFHVVFTLPAALGPIALQNRRVVYGTLFRAVAETLLTIAADPKHLGASIGFLAVLHTWGQKLHLHPHVHCVVPGGGISADGKRWVRCRPGFFLPVRVLSRLFRGKFLALLHGAFKKRRLIFHGGQRELAEPRMFDRWLQSLRQTEWMVYAKRPFGGPERVLKYLARYTHRVAISNSRLVKVEDDKVHLHWKDYADGNQRKTMALDAHEFIRRFLLHVLPSGFVRIRHYGLLANRHRKEKLELCRRLLSEPMATAKVLEETRPQELLNGNVEHEARCPLCGRGRMMIIEELKPDLSESIRDQAAGRHVRWDTS
jgi:hypothetical protein